MREAVGFFTHIATPDVLRNYRQLKDDLAGLAQTMIVAEEGTPVAEELREETHFFDFQKLAAASGLTASKIVPGNCHLAMLDFFDRWPDFDYYWYIEYDVAFTGSWRTLIQEFSHDDSDLLATHIRTQQEEPDWVWWRSLQLPPSMAEQGLTRAFMPICRLSRRGLERLKNAVQEGATGHFEALVPMALQAASLKISDLGEGEFYTSHSSRDGKLTSGTMRYRPYHFGALDARNHLYHPVKPSSLIEAELAEKNAIKRALTKERAKNNKLEQALSKERTEKKRIKQALIEERANHRAAKTRMASLLSSTSWRLTAPMRAARRYLKGSGETSDRKSKKL